MTEVEVQRIIVRLMGDSASFRKMIADAQTLINSATKDIVDQGKKLDAYKSSIDGVIKSIGTFGEGMRNFGRSMTTNVSLPIIGLGAAIFKVGSDFETEMAKIAGLTGTPRAMVEEWREELLKLGPALGKSPLELAKGMYFVASSGFTGKTALDLLTQSAMAAAAGLGETKDVTQLVTSVMSAYGEENISATRAIDVLVAAVREGKAEAEQFALTMGRVLPLSARLGISFEQTAAAIAIMTRSGTNAAESTTQLRSMLQHLLKPAEQSMKILDEYGLSLDEIIEKAGEGPDGLVNALTMVEEAFGDNKQAIGKLFPDINGLMGVLDLTGENGRKAAHVFTDAANSAGLMRVAFMHAADTSKHQLNVTMSELQVLLIEMGEDVLPFLTDLLRDAGKLLKTFGIAWSSLSPSIRNAIIPMAAFAVVLGPTLSLIGNLTKVVTAAGTAWSFLRANAAQSLPTFINWIASAGYPVTKHMTSQQRWAVALKKAWGNIIPNLKANIALYASAGGGIAGVSAAMAGLRKQIQWLLASLMPFYYRFIYATRIMYGFSAAIGAVIGYKLGQWIDETFDISGLKAFNDELERNEKLENAIIQRRDREAQKVMAEAREIEDPTARANFFQNEIVKAQGNVVDLEQHIQDTKKLIKEQQGLGVEAIPVNPLAWLFSGEGKHVREVTIKQLEEQTNELERQKKVLENLREARGEANREAERASRTAAKAVKEEVQTPEQKMAIEMAKNQDLLNKGLITREEFNKAAILLQEKYKTAVEETTKKTKESESVFKSFAETLSDFGSRLNITVTGLEETTNLFSKFYDVLSEGPKVTIPLLGSLGAVAVAVQGLMEKLEPAEPVKDLLKEVLPKREDLVGIDANSLEAIARAEQHIEELRFNAPSPEVAAGPRRIPRTLRIAQARKNLKDGGFTDEQQMLLNEEAVRKIAIKEPNALMNKDGIQIIAEKLSRLIELTEEYVTKPGINVKALNLKGTK